MLKKLFVHEWKDTWRLMAILNAAVVLLTLCGLMVFNKNGLGKLFEDVDRYEGSAGLLIAGVTTYTFIYFVMIAALSIASTLYFFIRFYKNLYTDQGYLMHTLPVTEHELIWSKTFVAVIWKVISSVVTVAAIFTLIGSAIGEAFWDGFAEAFGEIGVSIGSAKGVLVILLFLIFSLASTLFSIFMGYAAVSIGQQFAKNKVLASIGVYLGMQFAINMITNILTQGLVIGLSYSDILSNWEPTENTFIIGLLIGDLIIIAASAGLYALTHNFMKKKLNLE
ncbi:MAG: hypothetical protein IK078_01685 [Lachnospiraceae bacterium]|nr:hypothetical protein [Lachnospiraceae bacterium]